MLRFFKVLGLTLLGMVLLIVGTIGLFLYDMGSGFDSFEETPPEVNISEASNAFLLFSKTNGFRHGEAIEASIPFFREMAVENGWEVFITENAAVFNDNDLSKFDVVIWNNATGRNLTDRQRAAFKSYIESGGGFVGIHGAGDFSHDWDWYEDEVIKAQFSHHNMDFIPVPSTLALEKDTSFYQLTNGLKSSLSHSDEWYVFLDNPRQNGANILYTVDENQFNPSGNLSFLITDKDFGMGDDHPIVWFHELGDSRVFYSALGHHAGVFADENHKKMLTNAIQWAGRF